MFLVNKEEKKKGNGPLLYQSNMYQLLERKSNVSSGFIIVRCKWEIKERNQRNGAILFYLYILLENDKTRLLYFFSSKHDITFEAYTKTTRTTGKYIKETECCISK